MHEDNEREEAQEKSTRENKGLSRRALFTTAAGVVGAAALGFETATIIGQDRGAANSAGDPPSSAGPRSSFETPKRDASPTSSRTPLQDLHGTITPSDLHYERHHSGIPKIDPATYKLLVHGLVEYPTVFTLKDLKRFPSVTRICFLECSGNLGRQGGEKTSPQALCGLTSQSEWTGVLMSTILKEVGVKPDAKWFLAEG